MKRRNLLFALFLMVIFLIGCTSNGTSNNQSLDTNKEDDKFKVAILLPGSANDNSWNQYGYDAIMSCEKELGVEVAYSENVNGADQLQALRDYAGKGYNLIFGHGGQYEDDIAKVAKEFPDTYFVCVAGSNGGNGEIPNMSAVDTAPFQHGYMSGWMGGKITKSNMVGFITANEGVQVANNIIGGWREGVKDVNPDCATTVIYISDYGDVAAAREATIALIEQGCDVVAYELNAACRGVIDVCKEYDIPTLARSLNDIEVAPDQILTYYEFSWPPKFQSVVKSAMNDTFEPGLFYYGLHTDPQGWECIYDEEHSWNPRYVSEELIEEFNNTAVPKWKENPVKVYTAEEAKAGTMK